MVHRRPFCIVCIFMVLNIGCSRCQTETTTFGFDGDFSTTEFEYSMVSDGDFSSIPIGGDTTTSGVIGILSSDSTNDISTMAPEFGTSTELPFTNNDNEIPSESNPAFIDSTTDNVFMSTEIDTGNFGGGVTSNPLVIDLTTDNMFTSTELGGTNLRSDPSENPSVIDVTSDNFLTSSQPDASSNRNNMTTKPSISRITTDFVGNTESDIPKLDGTSFSDSNENDLTTVARATKGMDGEMTTVVRDISTSGIVTTVLSATENGVEHSESKAEPTTKDAGPIVGGVVGSLLCVAMVTVVIVVLWKTGLLEKWQKAFKNKFGSNRNQVHHEDIEKAMASEYDETKNEAVV